MLTTKNLILEKPNTIGGVQRIYRIGNSGLSAINSPMAHPYSFAWEIAVLKFKGQKSDDFELDYSTPLTDDVEVFLTDEEGNKFIKRWANWAILKK